MKNFLKKSADYVLEEPLEIFLDISDGIGQNLEEIHETYEGGFGETPRVTPEELLGVIARTFCKEFNAF